MSDSSELTKGQIGVIQNWLYRASTHLRKSSGRTETEGPRRILTEAAKIVGTDNVLDLNKRNIKVRVK